MDTREMTAADIAAVKVLWEVCGLTRPWNDPDQDIHFALSGPSSTGLVGTDEGTIVAALLVGHDGHRGSVYYVGVDPAARGKGYGRAIMQAAEDWLRGEGVWKLNLLVRQANDTVVKFYEALGYEDQDNRSLGKRLDGQADRSTSGSS